MRLATIADGTPDGRLAIVSPDGRKLLTCDYPLCKSLLSALQAWPQAFEILNAASLNLEHAAAPTCLDIETCQLLAPLPRTFAFLDGSAFLEHVRLSRQARAAELPADLITIPLMYQGLSDRLLASGAPIEMIDQDFGLDFEAEFAVVTTHVPQAIDATTALTHVALILLLNDWTYRNLLPREANTGFGFIQSKPASSVAPFAITPDQLGPDWHDGRINLDVNVRLNAQPVGRANGAEMHFNFGALIAHAARTRSLSAGTIIGGGTVSNSDPERGFSCIAERRARETIAGGKAVTPFLKRTDTIAIEVLREKHNLFGTLTNTIV